jgi:hypothetical protein
MHLEAIGSHGEVVAAKARGPKTEIETLRHSLFPTGSFNVTHAVLGLLLIKRIAALSGSSRRLCGLARDSASSKARHPPKAARSRRVAVVERGESDLPKHDNAAINPNSFVLPTPTPPVTHTQGATVNKGVR